MHDTFDVILAVIAAVGLGVFFGMPLGSPRTSRPVRVQQQATAHAQIRPELVVVAQGRAVAQDKR